MIFYGTCCNSHYISISGAVVLIFSNGEVCRQIIRTLLKGNLHGEAKNIELDKIKSAFLQTLLILELLVG